MDEKEASGSNPSASTGATSEQGLWAHPIGSRPEKGALIIARPDAFLESQRYFAEAVILLLSRCPFHADLALLLSLSPKVVEGVYSNGKWFELGGEDSPAVALDARQYKFFAQYAGWSPGQLERFVLSIFL